MMMPKPITRIISTNRGLTGEPDCRRKLPPCRTRDRGGLSTDAHPENKKVISTKMRPGSPAAPRVTSLAVLPFGPGAVRKPCRAGPNLISLLTTFRVCYARALYQIDQTLSNREPHRWAQKSREYAKI